MFGSLFDEEDVSSVNVMTTVYNFNVTVPLPPNPRRQCGLSGILNQGATCYLNSLLQTLLFTPEFREGLFKLTESQLGRLTEKGRGAKVRVIPLQLQKLFARLLLLDQEAASTTELTDSFGWKNSEELQQHDVQELNRILFAAIEKSLTGTAGNDLISKLYHGSTYSEIVCQVCGKISERVEDFLDLYVTVANFSSLQDSLSETYLQEEVMKGTNQYRCSTCYKLVDAKKGLKIRCLPPILTFSLSRFTYDIAKGERIKEIGKFTFPMELDMAPFCDKERKSEESNYELFSVVIHSGTSHAGHYRAYIRDIDGLGKWVAPDEEPVVLNTPTATTASVVQGPLALIKILLTQQPDHCLSVDKLCQEIMNSTGLSWGKRFKNAHGPINKFLQKHGEVLFFNACTNIVYLKEAAVKENLVDESMSIDSSPHHSGGSAPGSPQEAKKTHFKNPLKLNFFDKKKTPLLNPALHKDWFHFNDTKVNAVFVTEIEKQFSGKESAYMLFYRRKSLIRPEEARGNPIYLMPQWLLDMVKQENQDLKEQRELHDITTNTVTLQVHNGNNYEYKHGALHPKEDMNNSLELPIDRRKPLAEAKKAIHQLWSNNFSITSDNINLVFYIAKDLPAGFHLYEELNSSEDSKSLTEMGILEGTDIFVLDGDKEIGGIPVSVGCCCKPILLHISTVLPSGVSLKISTGIPKTTTFLELKTIICAHLPLEEAEIIVSRIEEKGNETIKIMIKDDQIGCNLADLSLTDNSCLLVECLSAMKNGCDKTVLLVVQDRTSAKYHVEIAKFPIIEINVNHQCAIQDLKNSVLSKFGLDNLKQYRFRKCTSEQQRSPPLHENKTVEEAGLTDAKYMILEEGKAPAENEITVTFSVGDTMDSDYFLETNVSAKSTVQQCLKHMLQYVCLTGDNWKLQKRNLFGEIETLYLETTTLEEEGIIHGDFLLVTANYVPPRGFMSFKIWLYPTQENLGYANQPHINGIISNFASLYKTVSLVAKSKCGLIELGDVELSGDSTVLDLKKSILTLPMLALVQLPNIHFLRVRQLDGSRPSKVIRGLSSSLKKLRLQSQQSLCVQLLAHEENLTQESILLNVSIRNSEQKTYTSPAELTWNTSESASLKFLKQELSNNLNILPERLVIAKHCYDKFEWLVMEDSANQKKTNKRWPNKKSNLRYSPYFLKDGDTIGVKDHITDPHGLDDFATAEDIEGQEILKKKDELKNQSNMDSMSNSIGDGKRQRRQTRSTGFYEEWTFDSGESDTEKCIVKKPERGIIIHVDDFR